MGILEAGGGGGEGGVTFAQQEARAIGVGGWGVVYYGRFRCRRISSKQSYRGAKINAGTRDNLQEQESAGQDASL